MPLLTYHGPGHRLLAFGQTVLRGDSAEFTEQEVRNLLAQPHVRVTVEAARAASTPSLGKQTLTLEVKHPASPSGVGASEALTGEGHTPSDKEEN